MTFANQLSVVILDHMHPVIGITSRPQVVKASAGEIPAQLATHTYIDSVTRAGGIPLILVPVELDDISNLLDRVDGIVLSGGGDVDPSLYDSDRTAQLRGVNEARDTFELELATQAFAREIPTFAICRGHQIMNVALGGTLIQDLGADGVAHDHDAWGDAVYEPHSTATVASDTRIANIIGAGARGINSIHHQAIDQLGKGLHVVATAPDGTIEAVEHESDSWDFISVQWHPEYLSAGGHEESDKLFTAFVETAAKFAANS